MSKNFALIGAAGYIAPRHLRAIKDTGNNLVVALDKTDNVGILDSFFPEAQFFTEFECFERFVELFGSGGKTLDYVSIVSPNYLHDAHIRFAVRSGANAICEKPLVLDPLDVLRLKEAEEACGQRVYTILQLRVHPSIISLREQVRQAIAADPSKRFEVSLTYLTSRGAWYLASWKGDDRKSGGIVTNIGIHFFDMLIWLFGSPEEAELHALTPDAAGGAMRFANADVRWFLSVNPGYLPEAATSKGQRTYRSITMDGEEVEFSEGFTDLHTQSYQGILAGEGFGLDDALPSIELVHGLRTKPLQAPQLLFHEMTRKVP